MLRGEHDPSDVTRLPHVPEGDLGVGEVEHGVRQGFELPPRQPVEDLPQQRAELVGPLLGQPVELEGVEGEAPLERQQPERRVALDVPPTDLHEAPVGAQEPKTLSDRLSRQRVQHDVDALSAGAGDRLLEPGRRAGVHDVRHAQLREVRPALRRAGRGQDLGSRELRHLHRGEAHAAGGRVDQHPLAGPQPGQVPQGAERGAERARRGRDLLRGEAPGAWRHQFLSGDHARAEGVGGDGHHLVAGLDAVDARTAGRDDAHAVHAEGGRAGDGDHAQRDQDVLEVQRRGLHAELDLTRVRRPPGRVAQHEVLEGARRVDLEPEGVAGPRAGPDDPPLLGRERRPRQATLERAPVPERDLVGSRVVVQLVDQGAEVLVGALRAEVDQPAPQVRPLVPEHAPGAPQSGRRQAGGGVVSGAHGPRADQPDAPRPRLAPARATREGRDLGHGGGLRGQDRVRVEALGVNRIQ